MVGLFAVSCSLIASVGECGCPPLDYQLSEREHFRTREVSSHPPPCTGRSTSSTRSTSAISGTIVPSNTRPHRQAQHIPRSPKREVCVRKCWEERELCERSSSTTAGTILSSLLHQSHLSDSAPSSIITSFLGVGG